MKRYTVYMWARIIEPRPGKPPWYHWKLGEIARSDHDAIGLAQGYPYPHSRERLLLVRHVS